MYKLVNFAKNKREILLDFSSGAKSNVDQQINDENGGGHNRNGAARHNQVHPERNKVKKPCYYSKTMYISPCSYFARNFWI